MRCCSESLCRLLTLVVAFACCAPANLDAAEPATPQAIATQVEILESPDLKPRQKAARELAQWAVDSPAAARALESFATDRDKLVRYFVHEAMVDSISDEFRKIAFSERVLAPLEHVATSKRAGERGEAIRRLGRVSSDAYRRRMVPALIRELKDAEPVVRNSALIALGAAGAAAYDAVPALGKMAAGTDAGESFEAALAISHIAPTDGLAIVKSRPPEFAMAESMTLALLERSLASGDVERHIEAALALSRLGPLAEPSIPVLRGMVKEKDPRVIYAAVRALVSITHESPEWLLKESEFRAAERSTPTAERISRAIEKLRHEIPALERTLDEALLVEQLEAARLIATLDYIIPAYSWHSVLDKAAKEPRSCQAGLVGICRSALFNRPEMETGVFADIREIPDVVVRRAAVDALLQAFRLLSQEQKLHRKELRELLQPFTSDADDEVRARAKMGMAKYPL